MLCVDLRISSRRGVCAQVTEGGLTIPKKTTEVTETTCPTEHEEQVIVFKWAELNKTYYPQLKLRFAYFRQISQRKRVCVDSIGKRADNYRRIK